METVNRPWWFEMASRSAAVDVPSSGDSADSTTSASGARTSRAAVTRSPGSSDLRGSDLVAVVRGDGRRDQRVGHAGDLAPVELDAGADDEVVVADALAARGRDGMRLGSTVSARSLTQVTPWGITEDSAPAALLERSAAAADQGPQRLVVVGVGRLDHGDVGLTGGAQPSGDADACGAAAEDEDSGLGHVPSWTSRVDRDEHMRCAGGTGALPEGRPTLR